MGTQPKARNIDTGIKVRWELAAHSLKPLCNYILLASNAVLKTPIKGTKRRAIII